MNKVLYSSLLVLFLLFSLVSAEDSLTSSSNGFKVNSNVFLDKSVSGDFGTFTQQLFRADELDINKIIILYTLFFAILFVLLNFMQLTPFFNNKALAFIASLIISLLIAISGAYWSSAIFLLNLTSSFSGGWDLIAMSIVVFVILVIWISLKEVVYFFKKSKEVADAKTIGFKIAWDTAVNKLFRS